MTKPAHPSYDRLVHALGLRLGQAPDGTTAVAAAFELEPQYANNWRSRGVPRDRADEAKRRYNINPTYILENEEPVLLDLRRAGESQETILNTDILEDAFRVIRGAAQWEGSESVDVQAREVAIAYALLADTKERVNETNLIRLVKAFMAKTRGAENEPARGKD